MFKIQNSNKPKTGFSILALAIAMVLVVLVFRLTVAPQVDAAPALPDGPDGGVVALENAIVAANMFPSPATIMLAKNGTYDLTAGTLNITSNITIKGRSSTINGNTTFGIFHVGDVGDLTLKNLTLSGGGSASNGGGIYISKGGAVTLKSTTISGNTAAGLGGGGIYISNGSTVRLH